MLGEVCPEVLGGSLIESKEALEGDSHESKQSPLLLTYSNVILSKLFISYELSFFYKTEVTIFAWNKCGKIKLNDCISIDNE